jgi:hypothetical protein
MRLWEGMVGRRVMLHCLIGLEWNAFFCLSEAHSYLWNIIWAINAGQRLVS